MIHPSLLRVVDGILVYTADMATSTSILLAALATGALAALHAAAPAIRRKLEDVSAALVASVGGGVAVAYVFLHLLPELATGNREIAEVLGERVTSPALTELVLFGVAMLGFVTLYGLDHVAEKHHAKGGVYAVHLGSFAVYNAIITYSLPTQLQVGPLFGLLFLIAMGAHFVLTDRTLADHYTDRFERTGRQVLVAALILGWLLAWVASPTRTIVVSGLLAALSGFVLYNVFSDELPDARRTRFPAFALSVGGYGGLLLALSASGAH